MLTVVTVGTLLFLTWQLATRKVEPAAPELQEQATFLARELAAVADKLQRSQERARILEEEASVMRQANHILRQQESERQAEINRLQGELDFYRRLVGTGGSQPGLAVYQAEILPTDSPRVFEFELTLTQNIRRASIINGRLQLEVEGTLADRPLTLDWSDLRDNGASAVPFRFKYFQQIEGFLTLPPDFSPLRLRVTLEPERAEPVVQEYRWKNVLATTAGEAAADPEPY